MVKKFLIALSAASMISVVSAQVGTAVKETAISATEKAKEMGSKVKAATETGTAKAIDKAKAQVHKAKSKIHRHKAKAAAETATN